MYNKERHLVAVQRLGGRETLQLSRDTRLVLLMVEPTARGRLAARSYHQRRHPTHAIFSRTSRRLHETRSFLLNYRHCGAQRESEV
ncbi:hypothetical protein PR048_021454 [Dryococelus australis]|uniref:Uncharacterized protein n=1 Tax=Dryococelus australis TaxID=614101 RepID=A0ABQ9GYB9_9NEOP|nr:hypothetical protein PR048_021454 [Dryococelus australis]